VDCRSMFQSQRIPMVALSIQESPTCKLLYVTPEQLVRNGTLHELLAGLHRRSRLARLVVDEALSALSSQDAVPT